MHKHSATCPQWQKGLAEEKKFWARWAEKQQDWFARKHTLSRNVRAMLDEWTPETTILDVGSGAISWLGTQVDEFEIKIVQADPLTDWFKTILRHETHESHNVFAEDLADYFGGRKFDLVHATNAIDHSADPAACLKGIAAVAKGPIYLEHLQNCAIVNKWKGLHKWNFDERDERIWIWGKDRQFVEGMQPPYDVAECLGVSAWGYRRHAEHGKHTYIEWRGWL